MVEMELEGYALIGAVGRALSGCDAQTPYYTWAVMGLLHTHSPVDIPAMREFIAACREGDGKSKMPAAWKWVYNHRDEADRVIGRAFVIASRLRQTVLDDEWTDRQRRERDMLECVTNMLTVLRNDPEVKPRLRVLYLALSRLDAEVEGFLEHGV